MTANTVSAYGIGAQLPAGFEARIFQRPRVGPGQPRPVAHFATFPLPTNAGDFGGGAVEQMGPSDIFVVLFEYGPESVGTALFSRSGIPRTLQPTDFRPYTLHRGLGGQAGTQWFFVEAGRPFTLYAVLGSQVLTSSLVPRLNTLLASIVVTSELSDTAKLGYRMQGAQLS